MATQASMIMTDNGMSFVINFKPYACTDDHPQYAKILEAAKAGNFDVIPALISARVAVEQAVQNDEYASSVIEISDSGVAYKGKLVHGVIVDRIIQMNRQGFDIVPMVRFMENLYQNPSSTAVRELYSFLEKASLPITDDGHFLAYKRVRDDYLSVHDGKTDNRIGTRLFMERNQVDDVRDNTCSYGFHFCSYDYLKHFSGSRTVILKINPKDVVTIPSDYNDTKGRANEYLVVGEVDHSRVMETNLLGEAGSVVENVKNIPGYVEPQVDEEDDEETTDNTPEVPSDWYTRNRTSSTPAPALAPVPSALTTSDATLQGYDDGYRSGRYGASIAYPTYVTSQQESEYNAARDEGFKDGRAHKVRKYKSPRKSNYE